MPATLLIAGHRSGNLVPARRTCPEQHRRVSGYGQPDTTAARHGSASTTDLPPISVDFQDVAEKAGLTSVLVSGTENRKRYILETTGTGVALFDYDNDGRIDIFLPNGTTLDPPPAGAQHVNRPGTCTETLAA